jgi:anti-sigma regulatory factor (Ser/Thr protein kinase)
MEKTIEVTEHSQVAEVRRVVAELGKANGMSEADLGRAALVATEVTTNLVKYARRGVAVVSWFEEGEASGMQIITADDGPGFSNFTQSAQDGYSTGGGLGIGIGTLMRTANVFDHYSIASAGAVFFTRITAGKELEKLPPGKLLIGSRTVPKPGQQQCGDGWAYKAVGRWQRICVVDGLGHGALAAAATDEAIRTFANCPEADSPSEIIMKAHAALKATRGAVMAIVAIDTKAGIASFSGVGNVSAAIFSNDSVRHLASAGGTVGYSVHSAPQYDYPWQPNSVLVMNTDGLSTRWNLSRSPGLLFKHPAMIAAALHRDFARDTDDSTIVVAKVMV